MPLRIDSAGAATERLRRLIAAEGGNPSAEPKARAKKPLPPPKVDAELHIKTADPATLPPPPVKGKSWDHQVRAYHWALPKKAAYLDFGMGAGKSRIAVALHFGREHRRTLILCPKSVVPGWPNQFRAHAEREDFMALPLTGGSVEKRVAVAEQFMKLAAVYGKSVAIVANYESIQGAAMQRFIKSADFDFLICDEAQVLKGHGGVISKTLHKLFRNADIHKLFLSGTPLPHSPLDSFGQFRLLDESVFGTVWTTFRLRYSIPDPVYHGSPSRFVDDPWINKDELAARMAPYMYHVGREVLDLPPAHHVVRDVILSPKARKVYDEVSKDFYAELDAGEVTAANALTRLLRLSQITSGFVRTDENGDLVEVDTAKREMLAETLDELPQREPVVVFARFTRDLDTIRAVAESQGRRYGEVSGRQNDLVESKYPHDADVLGVQIAAGGAGIDLSRSAYGIYWSLGFSLGEYDQSLARLDRPLADGTKRTDPVVFVHLVASNTVDTKIYRALAERRDVVQAIIGRMV